MDSGWVEGLRQSARSEETALTPSPAAQSLSPVQVQDKDFADLLAEFEDEAAASQNHDENIKVSPVVESSEVPLAAGSLLDLENDGPDDFLGGLDGGHQDVVSKDEPMLEMPEDATLGTTSTAAALFSDDEASGLDDILLPTTSIDQVQGVPAEPIMDSLDGPPTSHILAQDISPVPSLSIERDPQVDDQHPGDTSVQSLFANDSDWLADTTMDDSFAVGSGEPVAEEADNLQDQSVAFDIPEGWYGDDGQWNWYTDEEKEQVRQSMLLDAPTGDDSLGVISNTINTFSRSEPSFSSGTSCSR